MYDIALFPFSDGLKIEKKKYTSSFENYFLHFLTLQCAILIDFSGVFVAW